MILVSRNKPKDSQGFTLIEVLIAMTILAVISLSIYQAVTQTFRLRDTLMNDGEFHNGVRLAMGLMERDIALIYSPIIMNPGTSQRRRAPNPNIPLSQEEEEFQAVLNSELGQNTDYWLGVKDKTGIRASRFIGTEEKLQFISSGYVTLYKNKQESIFSKVQYELRPDEREEAIPSTKTLYKIEDPNAFDDSKREVAGLEKKSYPILYGIKKFKIRYFRSDKKAWERTWDNGKEEQKGIYPDLIELTIEVQGVKSLNFEGTYVFKPENLFNGIPNTF